VIDWFGELVVELSDEKKDGSVISLSTEKRMSLRLVKMTMTQLNIWSMATPIKDITQSTNLNITRQNTAGNIN